MYPDTGFTKGQVIEYYTNVARYIIPHLKDRPITLKRFPDGLDGEFFYEKDAPSFTPEWVKTFPIPRTSENSVINYILINDLPTLIWSANLANLELHPFLARIPNIDQPTSIVFDLDPGEGADIMSSCEVAFLLKELLDRLDLKSFVKVSGSKGIHLHIPLNSNVPYDATQPFAKSVAQMLENEHSDLIISEMPKAKRRGKVFVDWSQNSEHKSTVAVYSLRARANGPFVAMPVTWKKLKTVVKKGNPAGLFFAPDAALKKLKTSGDLFKPLLKLRQTLPQPFLDLMKEAPAAKSLEAYLRKRDFSKTAEPAGTIPRSSGQGSRKLFVVQKHAASHLHYDCRLEMRGTLKSWAVPKGPPFALNERRLAMATEDHPMDYAKFEGVIPKGEYGGGTVMVWDIGTYALMEGNYWKGELHFHLNGKKLRGEWLLKKDGDSNGRENKWHFIKVGESLPKPTEAAENTSALSGRNFNEIASAADAVWHSNRNGYKAPNANAQKSNNVTPSPQIEFREPMLAQPVASLPKDRDRWLYEVKLDGYRTLLGMYGSEAKVWSRRGHLVTDQFPKVANACKALPPNCLIDGEIVALDENSRISFNLLQHHRSKASAIRFYAFDALVVDGRSLLDRPLTERRDALREILPQTGAESQIALSENLDATPAELVRIVKEFGLEGIIAKRKDSLYEPGKRRGTWVKYKVNKEQEFVIGGYSVGNPFDAVIVGYYGDGKLIYASKVRNGFVPHVRRQVMERMEGLKIETCPFTNLPEKRRTQWSLTKEEMKKCRWLKPELVAQIEFTSWTPDGHLRHATFAGLREDKEASEVVREPGV
jgi:bifunctional non-homologous end joining protein LigD